MKNVLLFGYYGFQNTGDEALLQTIVGRMKKVRPKINITVLTYNEEETSKQYGVKAVNRNDMKKVLKAIKDSDVVISGGGSVLQDVTSSRSLLYYLAIIFTAKRLGKKVMFYGNGFGPITKGINKKICKYILDQVDVITVRDHPSKELMQSIGVKKNIQVTADVAFGMELPTVEKVDKLLRQEGLDQSKKIVGISVRSWKDHEDYKKVIAKMGDYLQKANHEVVFVPMHFPDDVNVSFQIADMMETKAKVLTNQYSPEELLTVISGLDLMVGMRLHSLIFAAIANVPMVGLEYDDKINSFLKLVNQRNAGRVESLDQIRLFTAIDEILQNCAFAKQELDQATAILRKKANMTQEIFLDLL
ncbi:polysaccharide pyruvyl transferase CsaB [Alkaliphilus hydrothermalis]|uniref:Polysaccharide pyruvyl transferase CsaB n=1 Tax=Alkaliphilus hydrothermalis TaxID=1482730 RepID=A0ABS2NMT5_9FIRM|nr:polysaccharide pyruvyl transferase CsaB [Alkaliphilus hydrothermalis]MBM7614257.1 polysaccharide pyruvyl transferase CsaB [Alkaliphilus hydrothermalis]